ncbi:dentin matrix acidic phosphoprotein 1-like [Hirundo rustica]|uniref:dentin matrix acidic phosphoprotein 1-like n=1 Tax=Hirundo rustica TaxID=43150 RepID=UPI001A946478|nr:dentin matrix acidic phosphoprotein 1-like [Hirundo rustica]
MRAAFLVLLLWAVACAHPVPGHEPTHPSALQEDATNEDYIGKLGNHLDGGDGRHPPAGPETGENALARDLTGGNAVDEELGELSGQDVGGRAGQAQHVNQVDHEDTGTHNGNDLGFLEADARDADDGHIGERYGAAADAFPSHGGAFLDEEDDSGDDTFDANGEEERGEGPTYVAGADGAGEGDAGRGDAGAGGRRGDSSSSSSSESVAADHRRYGNRGFGRAYGHGAGSSSSQEEEEGFDFQDEAMQGDDPSVFDGPGGSYRMRHAGPLGNSWESAQGAGSHRWEEGDSRSPEVEDGDSGEDSPSVEDNSQSEEPEDSQSEEKSSSHSQEDGDGEDSPSREDEDSESREGTDEQSDEEPGETPEVVRTLNEHSNSQTWEGQEDWDSAEDRSVLSTPDSESREEEEAELSKSREDDDDQSQSTEDTVEESEEDGNDSVPSTSAESPESPEDDSSPEDNTGEDSRSTESDNSESQEDDDDVESHSQEDATRESSSHGDDSSLQSPESGGRKRRLGALRHRPAADYDDNDCQDGY